MGELAHDNVVPLRRPPYDPRTGEVPEDVQAFINEIVGELEDAKRHSRSDGAKIRALNDEITELTDSFAPNEEWTEFGEWWVKFTGRNAKKTHIDAGTDRCKAYKKLRKRFSRRDIALMVVGCKRHHFAPFHKRDDMENFAKSIAWAEECLALGMEANPPKEEDAA
jgi:hypothetical protein